MNFADPQLACNRLSCVLVITRQEYRLNAQPAEVLHHLPAFLSDGVRQNEITSRYIVNC